MSEAQSEYHLIMAGFMSSKLIELSNATSLAIDKLLYAGGLRSYLENLDYLEDYDSFLTLAKNQQEGDISADKSQDTLISREAVSKAYTYHSIGLDRYREKNYERAIEDFNEAIRLNPKMAITYSMRGLARTKIKDYQGAIEDYTQALRILPKFAADLYYNQGKTHCDLKDKKRAIESFQKAAELYKQQGKQVNYQNVINIIKKLDVNIQRQSWNINDNVVHNVFVTSRVTNVFGIENKITLAIKFEGLGIKIIDPKNVTLQRIE